MLTIKCSCKNTYQVTGPFNPNGTNATCPHCGKVTILDSRLIENAVKAEKKAAEKKKKNIRPTTYIPTSNNVSSILKKIKTYRIISSVIWILIGIIQLILVYTAPVGLWNIVNAILTIVYTKNIIAGNTGVVTAYEKQKMWLIIAAIINLFFGGVVGVFLVATDWISRDYVLKNRYIFESQNDVTYNESVSESPNENKNFCHKCGSKLMNDAKFCSNCGESIQ